MVNKDENGALLNRIHEVTPDHIEWIKSQLIKPDNFIKASGRRVFVDVPLSNVSNLILIPAKGDSEYFAAWARVYNLALSYLEGSLREAYMHGGLDYRGVIWPEFEESNANYARELEKILDEYKLQKLVAEREKTGLLVKQTTVMVEPIEDFKVEDVSKEESEFEDDLEEESFMCYKAFDGDELDKRDFRELKENEAEMVILPCQSLDKRKEENLFLSNVSKCKEEGLKIGAFIYGKASDELTAPNELKSIYHLLDQCGDSLTKVVIYGINNDFVIKNQESEMKLLSLINAYTMIADGLSSEDYTTLLSMNLESKKILEDIYKRYNLESKYEFVYMILVRELDEITKEESNIVVDPGNNYDTVTIKGNKFHNNKILNDIVNKDMNLAKAA